MTTKSDIAKFLDALELTEARLLSWGVTDASFSEAEMIARATEFTGSSAEGNRLLQDLERRGLVFSFVRDGDRRFRTRSAESIRLLSELKQLFPKHAGSRWRQAPDLVADYRYVIRPRTRPARDLTAGAVIERLVAGGQLSEAAVSDLRELLGAVANWSDFQVTAIDRLLRRGYGQRGATVVTAGTGSGKTYAFFVPALFHLTQEIRSDPTRRTRIIAIYPRRELLADQLAEALRQIDRIRGDPRRIRVGAFFAAVPYSVESFRARPSPGWGQEPSGWKCPYLTCVSCGGALIWRSDDLAAGREALTCVRPGCGRRLGDDRIALTRTALQFAPPDLLFTTTESLNRRMTDRRYAHLFGTSGVSSIRLVLLDEVHIYEGIHGAQVALLLRRWQRLSNSRAHFVGLSATLENAAAFMSDLTGVGQYAVKEVAPTDAELLKFGAEYLLALRGDPASRTSLVSTTIQAAMLMARVLDVRSGPVSDGLFGSKVFVFTDDLDVTNRLYHSIRDAEGWGIPPRPGGSLANLRASAQPEHQARFVAGQSWDIGERIGHPLSPGSRLFVGRTTSQDEGVDRRADIVVATESLTVGFNDPDVGAVLQHKAPRHPAQFIQRRGRAGRDPDMRPWTVVVLSDYGRDRLAYQAYDQLFAPRVAPAGLPVRNRYVLRIQATFAVIDWIFMRFREEVSGSLWDLIKGGDNFAAPLRQKIARLLEQLLHRQELSDNLRRYLADALQIDLDEVDAICWEGPRPVLRGAVPVLLRRLENAEGIVGDSPLPEFMPASLFADLNLPEVAISISGMDDQALPIAQAIEEFAPGKVSRRYAVRDVRHWVAVQTEAGAQSIKLEESMTVDVVGTVSDPTGTQIQLVRPRTIRPVSPPRDLLDSSTSQLSWESEFATTRPGRPLAVVPPQWARLNLRCIFHLHALGSPAEVKRFVRNGVAETNARTGRRTLPYALTYNGAPAALGYFGTHDALRVVVDLHSTSWIPEDRARLAGFRSLYFAHVVAIDANLAGKANVFERQWLAQTYLSTLAAHAIATGSGLREARRSLRDEGDNYFREAISAIFQSVPDDPGGDGGEQLESRVLALITDADIFNRLSELSEVIWAEPDATAAEWARHRAASTYALALREAIIDTCPDAEAEDLSVDLSLTGNAAEIWISELSVGGVGSIETLMARVLADPQRFFRLVMANMGPSDLEIIDGEIPRFLELAVSDPLIAEHVASLRAADTQAQVHERFEALMKSLTERGIFTCHSVIAALAHRVLRRGSSVRTDEVLRTGLERWRTEEERLGVEIDARVMAFVLAKDAALQRLLGISQQDPSAIVSAYGRISSMLWPRGAELRALGLAGRSRFATLPPTDRLTALEPLKLQQSPLPVGPAWRSQMEDRLAQVGSATFTANSRQGAELKRALLSLAIEPATVGYMYLHPRISAVRRIADDLEIEVELREGVPA